MQPNVSNSAICVCFHIGARRSDIESSLSYNKERELKKVDHDIWKGINASLESIGAVPDPPDQCTLQCQLSHDSFLFLKPTTFTIITINAYRPETEGFMFLISFTKLSHRNRTAFFICDEGGERERGGDAFV
jgi:hypothetical protein